MTDRAQIYLATPPDPEGAGFSDTLARVMDAAPVAALRLDFATRDEGRLIHLIDAAREVAHARDVPAILADHLGLVTRLGLDGVHLSDGSRGVRKAREALGKDAVVGAFCGASRHDGMTAGEIGADYVAFGPAGETTLGSGERAGPDLFAWWSEMIELPVVAEGALTPETVRALAPAADFFAFGPEIWDTDDPAGALRALANAI
ncbi:thiamine-phosphate pyrophosphorylase [Hasllibacter halocynthiae]|uniref:Thiamine-phosphate pyrophosphorylase n=1 Tax=Hasllibacter halocynthiae TaxID=595589 RepID=A0A2T0X8C5_9RHOB|nr:thiamine phosphate synthase [Hasllibacter halocynthiae]PRY95202.1 thiamine-phosphate pyrophosphorylase [Hasllibacter halocynthiae]